MNEFNIRLHKNDDNEIVRVSLDIVDFHYFCHKGATQQKEPFEATIQLLKQLDEYQDVTMVELDHEEN